MGPGYVHSSDQFGHPAGDSVLTQVASMLTRESRSEAVVARYGGEEFAVILPAAAGVAERIRRAIEMGPWDLRPITVSIGSATMIDGELNRAALIARGCGYVSGNGQWSKLSL